MTKQSKGRIKIFWAYKDIKHLFPKQSLLRPLPDSALSKIREKPKKAWDPRGQQGKSQAELHSKPTKQAFILEQEDGGLKWESSGREGVGAR